MYVVIYQCSNNAANVQYSTKRSNDQCSTLIHQSIQQSMRQVVIKQLQLVYLYIKLLIQSSIKEVINTKSLQQQEINIPSY